MSWIQRGQGILGRTISEDVPGFDKVSLGSLLRGNDNSGGREWRFPENTLLVVLANAGTQLTLELGTARTRVLVRARSEKVPVFDKVSLGSRLRGNDIEVESTLRCAEKYWNSNGVH